MGELFDDLVVRNVSELHIPVEVTLHPHLKVVGARIRDVERRSAGRLNDDLAVGAGIGNITDETDLRLQLLNRSRGVRPDTHDFLSERSIFNDS